MLAAAHNSDLDGARTVGLATAFIARSAEYGFRQARDGLQELGPDRHIDHRSRPSAAG